MANEFDNEGSGPFNTLLRGAALVGVTGAALYPYYNSVKINRPVNPLSTGHLADVGEGVGRAFHGTAGIDRKQHIARAETIAKEILKADEIQALFRSVNERNVLIQSLLETMGDPEFGGTDPTTLMGYRQQLLEISKDAIDSDQAEDVIRQIVNAVTESGSSEVKARWGQRLQAYQGLGSQLQPPTPSTSAKQPYNVIEHANTKLSARAAQRLNRLQNVVGEGNVQVLYVPGVDQYYAQVFNKGGKWAGNFLLDSADNGSIDIRMGRSLNNTYTTHRAMLDANVLDRMMSAGTLRSQRDVLKARIDPLDMFIDEFERVFADNPYISGGRIGAWQKQFLTFKAKQVGRADDMGFGNHLAGSHAYQTNVAQVLNFGKRSKDERFKIVQKVAALPGMDQGPRRRRLMNRTSPRIGKQFGDPTAVIGFADGPGPVSEFRTAGKLDRVYLPATARMSQVYGRDVMYYQEAPRYMGKNGIFPAGATAVSGGRAANIGFGNNLSGGRNLMTVLDMTGGLLGKDLQGMGMGFSTGVTYSMKPFQTTILDPASNNLLASSFINDMLQYSPGEEFYVSRAQLKGYKNFIGKQAAGQSYFAFDPSTEGYRLRYEIGTNAEGQKILSLSGAEIRGQAEQKVFGPLHKGMVTYWRQVDEEAIAPGMKNFLTKIGVGTEDRLYAPGDMLGKGAAILDMQMTHAYAALTGDQDFIRTIRKNMVGIEGSEIHKVTAGVVRSLAAAGVSAEDAGKVLAGAYYAGDKYGMSKKDIKKMVRATYGKRIGNAVLASAREGVTFAPSTYTQGESVGDWKLGRGSVTPRLLKNLQYQFRRMGMSPKEVKEAMVDILKRTEGLGDKLAAADSLISMSESIAGARGIITELDQMNIPTYSLEDLRKLGLGSDEYGDFIKKHNKGFLLDFSKTATDADRLIAESMGNVFNGSQIYIPGQEAMGYMKTVTLQGGSKGENIVTRTEFEAMTTGFLRKIVGASTSSQRVEGAKGAATAFKDRALSLTSKVVANVGKGKVAGSIYGPALAYTDSVFGANDAARSKAKTLTKLHGGRVVFMDTHMFLTQLQDYMGSEGREEAVAKARKFYLDQGYEAIATRMPALSIGNSPIVKVFRDTREGNYAWKEFLKTGHGAKYKNFDSFFSAIAAGNSEEELFGDFVDASKQFSHRGGGMVSVPTWKNLVTNQAGRAYDIDVGIMLGAGGDMDADQLMVTPLTEKTAARVRRTMRGEMLDQVRRYDVATAVFTEEAKDVLKRTAAGMAGDMSLEDLVAQDILKEGATQEMIGKLDVQLDRVRTALLDTRNAKNYDLVDQAMALLKVVEEHTTIKGKKLPFFVPYADMLQQAVQAQFDGDETALRKLFKEVIYKDSALNDGMSLSGEGLGGQTVRLALDDALNAMSEAIGAARISGVANGVSAGQRNLQMQYEEEVFGQMRAGVDLETAMIQGHKGPSVATAAAKAEDVINRTKKVASTLNAKTGAAVAGATAVAAVAALMIGNHGGSLMPDGTVADVNLSGSLAARPPSVAPGLGYRSQYATIDAPINTNSVYAGSQNGYQIRGEIPAESGIGAIGNYMRSFGAGTFGSVKIRDDRRPLTANYVDQLLGEY